LLGAHARRSTAHARQVRVDGCVVFLFFSPFPQVGKAKQNILLKKVKEQEDRLFNWDKLRDKLNSERDVTGFPEGWQGGQKDLTEKQKIWNADLYGGGNADEEDDNGVTDTNVNAWKQVRNQETGDVYFWNIETDETSWEVPEGIVTDAPLSEFRGVTKTIPSPAGIDGVLWLCTQHTTGHAHYGCFFQVDAKDEDVWIIGIRTGAHYRSDIYESKYRVFVKDGPVYGNEISKEGWTQYGFKQVKAEIRKVGPKKWDYMGLSRDIKSSASSREELLPCICETDTDPETLYGAVPLERAIHIPAGTSKGLCIWCEDSMGIILRKKEPYMPTGGKGGKKIRRVEGGYFAKGEVTDENAHLVIKAGLVPRKDVFRSVVSQEAYAAFTGVLEYSLDSGKVPQRSSNDAEAEGEQFEPDSAGVVEIELAGQEGVDDEEAVGEAVSKLRLPEEAVKFPEEREKEVIKVDLSAPLLQEEEEEEEEEEEIDMEALLDGPGENIFGGDRDEDGGISYEPTGEFSLLCYVKDEASLPPPSFPGALKIKQHITTRKWWIGFTHHWHSKLLFVSLILSVYWPMCCGVAIDIWCHAAGSGRDERNKGHDVEGGLRRSPQSHWPRRRETHHYLSLSLSLSLCLSLCPVPLTRFLFSRHESASKLTRLFFPGGVHLPDA
jgi:hypothetical protein